MMSFVSLFTGEKARRNKKKLGGGRETNSGYFKSQQFTVGLKGRARALGIFTQD